MLFQYKNPLLLYFDALIHNYKAHIIIRFLFKNSCDSEFWIEFVKIIFKESGLLKTFLTKLTKLRVLTLTLPNKRLKTSRLNSWTNFAYFPQVWFHKYYLLGHSLTLFSVVQMLRSSTFKEGLIVRTKTTKFSQKSVPSWLWDEKAEGRSLQKYTKNHILACSLHLQLHAPLVRFEKHLN